MSELGDQPSDSVEKPVFTAESNFLVSPFDPYNERVIQFGVLKQLGYPVDIQKVPADELPEDFFELNEMEWERDNYPVWVRPLVNDIGFERFVESLSVTGDSITSDDEELNRKLSDHPVKLLWEVDTAGVHILAHEIDRFEKGESSYIRDSGSGILTRDLLIGCFMTALDRYIDKNSQGYTHWQDSTLFEVSIEDFVRYHIYQKQGFRPASPEQLGALVFDYYKLAEQAQPAILKFKVEQE